MQSLYGTAANSLDKVVSKSSKSYELAKNIALKVFVKIADEIRSLLPYTSNSYVSLCFWNIYFGIKRLNSNVLVANDGDLIQEAADPLFDAVYAEFLQYFGVFKEKIYSETNLDTFSVCFV